MAVDPGKYDELATLVRERAKARAAAVIVIAGDKGSGFSLQLELDLMGQFDKESVSVLATIIAALRTSADQIEIDMRAAGVYQK